MLRQYAHVLEKSKKEASEALMQNLFANGILSKTVRGNEYFRSYRGHTLGTAGENDPMIAFPVFYELCPNCAHGAFRALPKTRKKP